MPAMVKKEIRVTLQPFGTDESGESGIGIDVRVFRKLEGKRDWKPGAGIRFDAADAESVKAGIDAAVRKLARKAA